MIRITISTFSGPGRATERHTSVGTAADPPVLLLIIVLRHLRLGGRIDQRLFINKQTNWPRN